MKATLTKKPPAVEGWHIVDFGSVLYPNPTLVFVKEKDLANLATAYPNAKWSEVIEVIDSA